MSTPLRKLAEIQRWVLDAITSEAEPGSANIVLLPSRQQSAKERLDVYRHAYVARLLDVLREQFPCTRFAVGNELFDQFAVGYLQEHPPQSYTLARLADRWTDYLDRSRPRDWGEFVVELARLEQAIDRVFDGPGPEAMPAFSMLGATEQSGLAFVPGFELLTFRFPVSRYYTAWKAQHDPRWPNAAEQFAALFRREYIVRRHELTPAQFKLLAALHTGMSIERALEALCAAPGLDNLPPAETIRDWFSEWTARGFFVGTLP